MTYRARQDGVALINALLVTALVAALLTQLARREVETAARLELMLLSDQARHHALAAEALAIRLLERDAQDNATDHLAEAWAAPQRAFAVEGGLVVGRIIDLQGRLDLNAVRATEAEGPDPAALDRLARLIGQAGGERALAAQAAAWISPAGRAGRAPANAPHRPFHAASELAELPGIDGTLAARLAPLTAAMSGAVAINVNTAPPEVLAALAPAIGPNDVAALMSMRAEAPFQGIGDLRERAAQRLSPLAAAALDAVPLGVSSGWFLIELEARIGRGAARLSTVVRRSPEDGAVVVIQRGEGSP
jgi:general secretion pathway protein K